MKSSLPRKWHRAIGKGENEVEGKRHPKGRLEIIKPLDDCVQTQVLPLWKTYYIWDQAKYRLRQKNELFIDLTLSPREI